MLPEVGDADGLLLCVEAGAGHPLLVRMTHDLRQVLMMERVEDIEEVLARWTLVLRICCREVLGKLWVLLKLWPEPPDGELVVVGDLDLVDVRLLHEHLLAGEDILQEVFVDTCFVWQVVLDYKGISLTTRMDLRCLSRYWMKSAFDFSFHESSCAVM